LGLFGAILKKLQKKLKSKKEKEKNKKSKERPQAPNLAQARIQPTAHPGGLSQIGMAALFSRC
jgi:hypothetical protein